MGSVGYVNGFPTDLLDNPASEVKPRRWIGHSVLSKNLNSSTRDALGGQETFTFPHKETSKAVLRLENRTEGTFDFIKDPHFRKHLYRMKVTYKFWVEKAVNGRSTLMDWRQVLLSNLKEGPAFAERLSKLITYSYRWKTGVAFYNFPQEYIDERAWGFDYFPSPFHLLPYKGECDDFVITEKVPRLAKVLRDRFIEEGSKCVKEAKYDIFFDDVDVVSSLTAKSVLVRPGKTEPNLTARAKEGFPGSVTSYFTYQEAVIYKCPHEQRACWIPTIETHNSVRLAKKIIKETLKSPCDYYFKRPSWAFLQDYLRKRDRTFFIMSDLKKSGLTFPHHLVLWAKELIDQKNPHIDTSVLGGYVNSRVYHPDGKGWYSPNIGTGLGMADPLISWTVSVIFLSWKKQWDEDYNIHGLFWGDDQIIKVYPKVGVSLDEYKAAEIGKSWDKYQQAFGLTVHESKPFVSTTGCLLETYPEKVPGWDCLKRGQWIGSLFWALGSETIFQAKEYVNAVYTSLAEFGDMVDLADVAINEEIIPRFGYEFFPDEVNYPFELGGWTKVIKKGLSQALIMGLRLPPGRGGLMRLPFIERGKARGCRYEVHNEEQLLGKGPPFFQDMARSALYPDYFRPSYRREAEMYRRLSKKRKDAYMCPGDPLVILRSYIKKVNCSFEMPDEFCSDIDKAIDFIPIEDIKIGIKDNEPDGICPTRARIFVEEIIYKNDYTTTLSWWIPSFHQAQLAALRGIIGDSTVLSPSLFKFCESDPRAYKRQLANLLDRGLRIHPNITKEFGEIRLPLPKIGKADTWGRDPFTGAYFLYSVDELIHSNWSENTCWSKILHRRVGNEHLETIKVFIPKEDTPLSDEEGEPPDVPEDYDNLVLNVRHNIEGARKALLELDPVRDQAQEDLDAVYARYQLQGNDDSDFDLDGGIDFDDLGVG